MSSKLPYDPNNKKRKEPFGELIHQMNQFFQERPMKGLLQNIDDFFKSPFPTGSFPVKVKETAKEYEIRAELPGIKKEQIQLNVLGNTISIFVKNHEEIIEEDANNKVIRKEHSISHFSRTIPLPQQINERLVKASYQNGLLQIVVPKQKGKSITIDPE